MKLSAVDGSADRVIGWQAASVAAMAVPAISCKKVRRPSVCSVLTQLLEDIVFLLKQVE
jgi:hypothetical protein